MPDSSASRRFSVVDARTLRTLCTSLMSFRISVINFRSSAVVSSSSMSAVLAVSAPGVLVKSVLDMLSVLLVMARELDSTRRFISNLSSVDMSSRALDKAFCIWSCVLFWILSFCSFTCCVSLAHSCTRIPATSSWYLTKWTPNSCSAVSTARIRFSILAEALSLFASSQVTMDFLSFPFSRGCFWEPSLLLSSIISSQALYIQC
mmetsp:Transcript_166742/g.320159  ORF Transcript_166742/g.320159 Transcript_166742/m.320159 type:complete len:205 (+) Transcript_166742:949-1563(+)